VIASAGRGGGWIVTASGRRFHPLDPRPDDVLLEDVARALSNLCRFTGHTREFYSVAEHSCRVALEAYRSSGDPREGLAGLYHDAAEAYVNDLSTPLKHSHALTGYRIVEAGVQAAVARAAGVSPEKSWHVARADRVLLLTEARDLLPGGLDALWVDANGLFPLSEPILPYSPAAARAWFLELDGSFKQLMRAGNA